MPGNNFAAVRLAAATLVVFGHSYVLTGQQAPTWFGVFVHTAAVRVFFTVSGYLIAQSWNQDPHLPRYLARRALRIMPGLVAVVALTVLVLGPSMTRLTLAGYAASPVTATYLWNALLAPAYLLPGVFDDGRVTPAVNGSLWSLPVEVAMYLALPLYGLRRWWACRAVLLPLAAACVLAGSFWFTAVRPGQVEPVVYWTSLPFTIRYGSDFVLGAAAYVWRLERLLRLQAAVVLMAAVPLLSPYPCAQAAASLLALPYCVLAFCLAPHPAFGVLGRRADISYGVYLYGAPLQQVVISILGTGVNPLVLTALAVPGAWAFGWASWHGLEKWALRLKPQRVASPG